MDIKDKVLAIGGIVTGLLGFAALYILITALFYALLIFAVLWILQLFGVNVPLLMLA